VNRQWLLENADTPIRYNLDKYAVTAERLLQNSEVSAWLSHLAERSQTGNIGDIHGSHDYRMENILGKCWILGLSKDIRQFADSISFITDFLNRHIQTAPADDLSFSKIYHYRDCEKVLGCFLPFLGYSDDIAVLHIIRKRIDVLYSFTRQKCYGIYIDGSKLKGVKKDWQPYIINPDLYADGHIALPDIHDSILFASMFNRLTDEEQKKVETIVEWLFDEGYRSIIRRYGYFYAPGGGSYNAKAVIFKLHLLNFQDMSFDKGDLASLLFNVYILSHFRAAIESEWFSLALSFLDQYKNENARYAFPSYFITEKPDSYTIFGGHMNVGENRRSKLYNEIISTYWMERIFQNKVTI